MRSEQRKVLRSRGERNPCFNIWISRTTGGSRITLNHNGGSTVVGLSPESFSAWERNETFAGLWRCVPPASQHVRDFAGIRGMLVSWQLPWQHSGDAALFGQKAVPTDENRMSPTPVSANAILLVRSKSMPLCVSTNLAKVAGHCGYSSSRSSVRPA